MAMPGWQHHRLCRGIIIIIIVITLDTDSRSLFHFSHHCRIGIVGDFLEFLIQSLADFHGTWRNDENESNTFWEQSGRNPDPDPD